MPPMTDWLNRQWIPFGRWEWHTLADRPAIEETHNLSCFLESLGLENFKVYHGPTNPQFGERPKQYETNQEILFTCSEETFFAFKRILEAHIPPFTEAERWLKVLQCPV